MEATMPADPFTEQQQYDLERTDELASAVATRRGLSRRAALQLLGAAAAGRLLKRADAQESTCEMTGGDPLIEKPLPDDLFRRHGAGAAEMRWSALATRGYLVPQAMWYVHTRAHTPRLKAEGWRLRIEGPSVEKPAQFTLDDLLKMPAVSYVRAKECGQNGHIFFEEVLKQTPRGGIPFRLGAICVAEFTGVPLGEVLGRAGVRRNTRDVQFQSLDDLRYTKTIPYSKAMQDDTLLVYAANGDPLLPDSGFPAAVLISGWLANRNVKWVGRIVASNHSLLTPAEFDTAFIGPTYKPEPPYPGQPAFAQNVKSSFELPWPATIPAGPTLLRGRSWSGHGRIRKVDVSTDGGRTWRGARLRMPNPDFAWVRWDLDWNPMPGNYGLQARATDSRWNTQPLSQPFNLRGICYGAVVSHPVTVVPAERAIGVTTGDRGAG
jgi:sulfane dehydrogenase subunit SoxC